LTSCIAVVTHGVGTVERSFAVGDDFTKWRATAPPIAPGRGRLIVYPGGSLSIVYETTSFGKGGELDFVVDRDVCQVLGRTFVFLDVPAGAHKISADDVSDILHPFEYRLGKYKLELTVDAGTTSYVRIDKDRSAGAVGAAYIPRLAAAAAEAELKDFVLDKDGLKCRPNAAQDRK
jgi:hypothetical protein